MKVDGEFDSENSSSDVDIEHVHHDNCESNDEDLSSSDHVRVVVRCRPLKSSKEQDGTAEICLQPDEKTICVQTRGTNKVFQFACVADPKKGQEYVFKKTGKHVVECALSGFNGAVVAYGQTGSGKTYTMQGPGLGKRDQQDHLSKGIIQRVCETIFAHKAEQESINSSIAFTITAEYLEIYNETVKDLLFEGDSKRSKKTPKVGIFEDANGSIIVQNQTTVNVSSPEDCYRLLREGGTRRTVGATNMNSESSRSHAVFTLQIDKNDQAKGVKRKSKLHLVDLAGSERQRGTGSSGIRLKEAGGINKSLSALGNVINALAEREGARRRGERPGRIPSYRDSKLTFLLKDSFGGNSKLCLIATISPAAGSVDETTNTLEFAKRCSSVRNEAVVNEQLSEDVARLQAEIRKLQQTIKQLKASLAKAKSTEMELRASMTKVHTVPVHISGGKLSRGQATESKKEAMDEPRQVGELDKILKTVDTEKVLEVAESLALGKLEQEEKESCVEKLCVLLSAAVSRQIYFHEREKELKEKAESNHERWLEMLKQNEQLEQSMRRRDGSAESRSGESEMKLLRHRITVLEEELAEANALLNAGERRESGKRSEEDTQQRWLEMLKANEDLLVHLKQANQELFQVRQQGIESAYGPNAEKLLSMLEGRKDSNSTEVRVLQNRIKALEGELVEFAQISLAAHNEGHNVQTAGTGTSRSAIDVDLSSDLEDCGEELFDRSSSEKENDKGTSVVRKRGRPRPNKDRIRDAEQLLAEATKEVNVQDVLEASEEEFAYEDVKLKRQSKRRQVLQPLRESISNLQQVFE